MYKFLVTGGAGFIGSNITESLLSQGHFVRVFDNFATGKRENITDFLQNPAFELAEGDLRNFQDVQQATRDIDFVLHQGALPSVPRSVADPITTNEVNVNGTLHVLQASRENKVKRVVYAASSSAYGNSPTLPKEESMPPMPLSPYAVSKFGGEAYCRVFHQIYGLETVALRYFNVFGPKQDPTSQYSAVIPKFIAMIRKGESPVIYGDGLQSRDFTYVDNNIQANILACTAKDAPGKVYNIACGQRFTLIQLVDALNNIMGTRVQPIFEPDRAGDVKHSLAAITRAQHDLGFEVTVDFLHGLRKTVEYFSLLS
jgi:nucleoside-diphosphate-sugar epimerase